MIRTRLRSLRIVDVRRTVAVRWSVAIRSISIAIAVSIGVQANVSVRNDAHRRARPRSEGLGARDNFLTGERLAVLGDWPQRTAAAVVHHERPFTSRAVIKISLWFEETGQFVEHFY
jgi:hypothetical protein